MKADELFTWDKADLAIFLADMYLDAEDLKEVFPPIDDVDKLDVKMFHDYIEKNWEEILFRIDDEDIVEWLNEVGCEEVYEEQSYAEQRDTDSINDYLALIESFRSQDYVGLKGYPAKRLGS